MRLVGFALLWALCSLAACRSSAPTPNRNGMPAFAKSVRVETALDTEELIAAVHGVLAEEGFRSSGTNLILTEPAFVGDISVRVTARIQASTVTASSEYAEDPQAQPSAEVLWRVARNAAGPGEAVFLAMDAIFRRLPAERVAYLFEE